MKKLDARISTLEAASKPAIERSTIRLYDVETGPPELDADDTPAVAIWLPRNGREAPDAP